MARGLGRHWVESRSNIPSERYYQMDVDNMTLEFGYYCFDGNLNVCLALYDSAKLFSYLTLKEHHDELLVRDHEDIQLLHPFSLELRSLGYQNQSISLIAEEAVETLDEIVRQIENTKVSRTDLPVLPRRFAKQHEYLQ